MNLPIPLSTNGRWVLRDWWDWMKPGEAASTPDEDESAPWASDARTPLDRLDTALKLKGRELHDLRQYDRTKHYDPKFWGWFRDGDPKQNIPSRAKGRGTRTAEKTTALCVHTMDVEVSWPRCLGMPVHLAVDEDADAVLCHDLLTIVWAAHSWNKFSVSLEISGHSKATPEQVDTARLLCVYVRDEIRRRRHLELRFPASDRVAVGGHFMATNKRGLSDPGRQIWEDVVEWSIAEAGYVLGPVTGKGQPPPKSWRVSG